jgi:hypothetical protein
MSRSPEALVHLL